MTDVRHRVPLCYKGTLVWPTVKHTWIEGHVTLLTVMSAIRLIQLRVRCAPLSVC